MYVKMLSPELIITGFVENENRCNYEKYLLEFVNKSRYFLNKSGNQLYYAPLSEANGEYDCISDTYELDFKLIASQSLLRAMSDLSFRKTLLYPGVTATHSPKKKSDSQVATHIYAILQEFSYAQLCQLRKRSICSIKDVGEKDVFQLLITLETKKNLLLFLPYKFYPQSNSQFSCGIAEIQDKINCYFQNAITYRRETAKGFDTYLGCLYAEYMLFMEEKNGVLICVDNVRLSDSLTYVELNQYTT